MVIRPPSHTKKCIPQQSCHDDNLQIVQMCAQTYVEKTLRCSNSVNVNEPTIFSRKGSRYCSVGASGSGADITAEAEAKTASRTTAIVKIVIASAGGYRGIF